VVNIYYGKISQIHHQKHSPENINCIPSELRISRTMLGDGSSGRMLA
jgi:hypothetical protein